MRAVGGKHARLSAKLCQTDSGRRTSRPQRQKRLLAARPIFSRALSGRGRAAQPLVARVNAGSESLLIGDAGEQRRQLFALVFVQRSADRLTAEIEREGRRVMRVTGDVTRFADLEAMRDSIERELGPVDVLVANAGGSFSPPGSLEDTTEEGFRASVEGNLTATFLTLKSFLPGMKQRRSGNVITVSSAAGRRPHPRSPIPYAAAKAGVELMTQDVAAQVGPYNVRVNCIAPETILTERNLERIPEQQKVPLIEAHPLRRLGTPEDVAQAALFLASSASSWITGVVLDVAGGAVMVG
jgi:3-oxoacyl-[acyl-carrier protein] reductase